MLIAYKPNIYKMAVPSKSNEHIYQFTVGSKTREVGNSSNADNFWFLIFEIFVIVNLLNVTVCDVGRAEIYKLKIQTK